MTLRSGDERTARLRLRKRAILLGASVDIRRTARAVRGNVALQLKCIAAFPAEGRPEGEPVKLAGVPVLGGADDFLGGRITDARADMLVLATRPKKRDEARAILKCAASHGLTVSIAETRPDGAFALRPMSLNDVIGAPMGGVDWSRVCGAIAGKRVLITGGAGSIGGELSRRVAALAPAHLTVIDNSEYNLSHIEQDLGVFGAALSHAIRFCDIRDAESVKRVFAAERPDIVFHAAAMKHVPIVEQNACEGALTNVLGSRNIAEAADAARAHLVFVSTDKAANPVSVMGATKRLMELYCQALDRASPRNGPRRLVARLGNVLGSAGSVAPLFERQIAQGGPLTITHRDVARYFITIEQAAEFLLRAAAVGLDSEDARGAALVLDMGEPLRVEDLARDMIRLHGLEPDRDVEIKLVGLRPGEKLREELIADDEQEVATVSPGVRAAVAPPASLADMSRRLERVIAAARTGSDDVVRSLVHDMVAQAAAVRVAG